MQPRKQNRSSRPKLALTIASIAATGILLISQEAQVSEVFYESSGESLERLIGRSAHVVISGGAIKSEILREVVFPKSTHYAKSTETKFQEDVEIFDVLEVLKSPAIQKSRIGVHTAPDYGESSIRAYHEENQTESPIIRQYKAQHPPKSGEKRILFLGEYSVRGDEKTKTAVYEFNGAEGMKSLEEVKRLIAAAKQK